MDTKRIWLIRHALVEAASRQVYYGCMDVPVCRDALQAEAARFAALAAVLPRPAHWIVTSLSRTRHTAEAIMRAGYPETVLHEDDGFIEQHLGSWQGLPHAELDTKLTQPAHPFWPLAAAEAPPDGESMEAIVPRVGAALDRAAALPGPDVVVVSHGGAIRAALAHALNVPMQTTLHFAVQNLSLTRLQHSAAGWQTVCVNALHGTT